MRPLRSVSVVMISWSPTDERLKLLGQSLASLREHTHHPYTLVVVDNGPEAQRPVIEEFTPDYHIINEINKGVGTSRNQGASATDSEFIAFVDSDIEFFPNWLTCCLEVLQEWPEKKLIVSAVKNKPMRLPKYKRGTLDGYTLHARCAGMAMVMRRSSYEELGRFDERRTNVGDRFCAAAKRRRYLFVHHPDWKGRHLGKEASYHYKYQIFNPETGIWTPRAKESKT